MTSRQLAIFWLGGPPLVLVLCVLYFGYAPDLLLNPITRYLYPQREQNWGGMMPLIPAVFQVGEPRARVVGELKAAGFEELSHNEMPDNKLALSRPAGANIACGYEFDVTLTFGPDDGLMQADSMHGGACL
jgi:hypothetical protein